MGAFGAPTVKPSLVWSNMHQVEAFKRMLSKETQKAMRQALADSSSQPPTKRYKDASGKERVQGTKTLRATQTHS